MRNAACLLCGYEKLMQMCDVQLPGTSESQLAVSGMNAFPNATTTGTDAGHPGPQREQVQLSRSAKQDHEQVY